MNPIVHIADGVFAHFLDTSCILNRANHFNIDSIHTPYVTPEVIQEIRQHPDVMFNSYLDRLLKYTKVVGRDTFRREGLGQMYEYIYGCTSALTPELRRHMEQLDAENPPVAEKYGKALRLTQHVADHTFLWHRNHCYLTKRPTGFADPEDIKKEKPHRFAKAIRDQSRWLHNAYYKYHRARFQGLRDGSYRWTDERLAAAALITALAQSKLSVIHTEDLDFVIILKQATDNLILESCNREAATHPVKDRADIVSRCYASRSLFVEEWRQTELRQRRIPEQEVRRLLGAHHPNDALFLLATLSCRPGDVLVYHNKFCVGFPHLFPKELVQDVARKTQTICK